MRAELLYGAYRSARSEANLRLLGMLFRSFPSLAFDDAAADCYGRIRATLAQQGTPIGPNDLMIAAIALRALAKPIAQAHSLILVTHNSREFSRVAGLQLEDWEDG